MNIPTSAMSVVFPLGIFAGQVPVNSPAYHWISLHPNFIVGMADLRARAGTFTTPWNATSPYRCALPELTAEHRSLSELMDIRGQEIYNNAKESNRKIMVMWSGGIDSTSIIVSLLKAIPAVEQKDMLVICLSPDSVLENLNFYRQYISNKIPVVHRLNVDLNNEFLDQYILLHGDPGDALFGPSSGKYKHLMDLNKHLLPYRDNIDLLYGCLSSNEFPETGPWIVDKIVANLDEVKPDNVKTIADWFWWQYVNFKWEGSLWRPFHSASMRKNQQEAITETNSRYYLDNVFFNADYFLQWSHTNLDRLFPGGPESHKHEVKQYIFNFNHDHAYQKYKTKIISMPLNLVNGIEKNFYQQSAFYDSNWIGYTLDDPELYNQTLDLLLQYNG
jgi:hypothetical protein